MKKVVGLLDEQAVPFLSNIIHNYIKAYYMCTNCKLLHLINPSIMKVKYKDFYMW